jgi:lipopolysaccharide transport system permease protein
MWAIIRPLLTMIVFTFVFGRVAKMDTHSDVPYALIVFAGLLPWQFFSNALTESSNSLIGNTNLITKVYFPRMIIPASSVITSFIDFFISFFILLVLFIVYQYVPPVQIFLMPVFWVMVFLASFGPGLYLTALNVKYRDFRYIIPFIVQFGLFISPVGYSSTQIPAKWLWAYSLNPMVGVIDGFRWCIVKDAPNPMLHYPFYISLAVTLFFVFLSIYQFRKMEKNFADLI